VKPVTCGIVGCGNICDIYFQAGQRFESIEIVACADLVKDRAKAKAKEHNIPKPLTVEKLLADPDIEIVINLTVPGTHGDIGLETLQAGKSIYNEKPLAINREQAGQMLALAKERGLRVGCAPDTFMGAAIQTCRKIIDDGWIGEPVAATAFMMGHGHEHWHPNPEFFYKPGGGPLFDMGPYYLTALCSLIGPIRRVAASTRISFPERLISSRPNRGTRIKVTTPTHLAGIVDFHNKAIGTIIMSFDVWGHHLPHIEIHGAEGSMSVPDPNCFGGSVMVKRGLDGEWREMPFTHGYSDNSRGLGVADMACAIRSGRPHRASGDLAYHVLDVMHCFHESSTADHYVETQDPCPRPAPLPTGLLDGTLDP
jgi:predicted dehydrogenase